MSETEYKKVLRLAGSYYKLPEVSEEDFHAFISSDHAVKAAKIHEKYGILHYQLAIGTSHTRELAYGLKLPWKIDDHDVTIEYYFTDVSALLAVSADEEFKALHVDAEKFVRLDATTVAVTWVEVFLKDGKLVNIGPDGKSQHPPFAKRIDFALPDKPAAKYY
ncbi:hypothetical protein CNMCM5623_002426 [Aspergillus felis]|uniref:EthD domain-containing protein n=1 Tax=Aspergillus felis TaxID=1287682 RepID=A0A8H6UZE4_9EURO|nr:hypothetical protein CNMCM5623_002426 [Aspergillus felis]KAF7183980.1 hypothetical protein CNMCM7691_004470 [Aspergillus felis]